MPPVSKQDSEFGEACHELAGVWHPKICSEFDGMLEASDLPVERFTSYYFGRTAPLAGGCTNIAVTPDRSAGGETILGRNYDWAYKDRRWCEARTIAPSDETPRIGYTHHWGGLCDVMNRAGLTISIAALPRVRTTAPGLQWHIVADFVATSCRSALEAADVLTRMPHLRSLSYLVADAETARLVETSPAGVRVREPDDGILVGTNHRLEDETTAGIRGRPSGIRRARALHLLSAYGRDIGTEEIVRVLSDHEGGICAGAHEEHEGAPGARQGSGTIWSLVAKPGAARLVVAPGHPCRTPFEGIPW